MSKHRLAAEAVDAELWNREDASDLVRPSDLAKYRILVSSRDWTIDTIVRQVEQGHIDLDPAFQRRNAWKDSRRSRLIESFIMGFPVPQLVLAENPRRKGSFIVIDGKQRLLTIAGFFLEQFRSYWNQPKLTGLSVLMELNKVTIERFLNAVEFADQRRQLANADIRTTVITGFRDEEVLYDIFYRINTGSVPLSSQELRQALNGGPFSAYLLEITNEKNALWSVLRIDGPDARLRDVELLLRLIAWRRYSRKYKGNMKPFLDDAMKSLNDTWVSEQAATEKLVQDIMRGVEAAVEIFGEYVGRKLKGGEYESSINRALFEVQTYYLSFPKIRASAIRNAKAVVSAFHKLSDNAAFIDSIESTTKSIENYKTRFGAYRECVGRALPVELDEFTVGSPRR